MRNLGSWRTASFCTEIENLAPQRLRRFRGTLGGVLVAFQPVPLWSRVEKSGEGFLGWL